jgi:cell wall-associated NlpC family hydrolase
MTFDYDRQKTNARVTMDCEIHRWGAPPGSVVELKNLGPITGRWLVQDIKRDLFSTRATIELIKPLPKLPEPPTSTGSTTPDSLLVGATSGQAQAIVQAAQRALSQKSRYTYRQYRPMASSLFDAFAYNHTDCSAFVTLCYKAGGAPDPNGFGYNGSGFTGTLWAHGNYIGKNISDGQPGDLAFFGLWPSPRGTPITTHVGLYIGGGQIIEFGSNPIAQNPLAGRSDFIGFRRYLGLGTSGH